MSLDPYLGSGFLGVMPSSTASGSCCVFRSAAGIGVIPVICTVTGLTPWVVITDVPFIGIVFVRPFLRRESAPDAIILISESPFSFQSGVDSSITVYLRSIRHQDPTPISC